MNKKCIIVILTSVLAGIGLSSALLHEYYSDKTVYEITLRKADENG